MKEEENLSVSNHSDGLTKKIVKKGFRKSRAIRKKKRNNYRKRNIKKNVRFKENMLSIKDAVVIINASNTSANYSQYTQSIKSDNESTNSNVVTKLNWDNNEELKSTIVKPVRNFN